MMKMNLSKRHDKTSKKRKKPSLSYALSLSITTCNVNVTGLGNLGGGMNDDVNGANENELDCLEAMMMSTTATRGAKNPPPPPQEFSSVDTHEASTLSRSTTSCHGSPNPLPPPPPPPPPGIHQIPNIRIELARHLQTQTLSTFLRKSCPGIRMPTFERWILDSKLEESDRFHSIIVEWIHNPSLKMAFTESNMMKKKKKYGRAARYDESTGSKKDAPSSSSSSSRRQERERARFDKDCKLVLEAEKRTTTSSLPRQQQQQQQSQATTDVISNTILCNIDRDAILPSDVMETDPSCDRLIKEILATMSSTNNDNTSATDLTRREENAKEIVRELCHRSAEACKELHHLERRLGKYQKFSWDCGATTSGDSKRKRRGDGGGGGRSSIDKVLVEWHDDNQLCSLVFVPKKQKSSSRSTSRRSSEGDNQHDDTSSNRTKPKPFVVKINSSHYHKLRKMFDSTYRSSETIFIENKDQTMTTAFHAVLFSLIIRYSALSGGQLLNDWRGGGMQGAVHDTVFDCLSKWFGGSGVGPTAASTISSGTECFASPFNSALSTYFSAFPSPDLDGHFGSYGDFFYPTASSPSSSNKDSIFLRPGWFELNPPFSPGVMMKMAHRINELLDMQTNLDLDVTYVVIIPTVRSGTNHADVLSVHAAKDSTQKKKQKKHHASDDGHNMNTTNLMTAVVNQAAAQPFYQLTNSPYCKYHIILPPREHGYVEGSQHLRPTQFKESQYSTSVIVLRTKCSSSSSGDTMRLGDDGRDTKESFESELRTAFASRHAIEAAQRKEGK